MKVPEQNTRGTGQIFFDAKTGSLFTADNAQCLKTYSLIGPTGLRDLSARLLALADEMEAKQ